MSVLRPPVRAMALGLAFSASLCCVPSHSGSSKTGIGPRQLASAVSRVPCGLPASLLARGFPRTLKPVQPQRPDIPLPGTLTIAVLPDTQYYALCRYPHLHTQTEWLIEHSAELNLTAAIHL